MRTFRLSSLSNFNKIIFCVFHSPSQLLRLLLLLLHRFSQNRSMMMLELVLSNWLHLSLCDRASVWLNSKQQYASKYLLAKEKIHAREETWERERGFDHKISHIIRYPFQNVASFSYWHCSSCARLFFAIAIHICVCVQRTLKWNHFPCRTHLGKGRLAQRWIL